MCGEGAECMCLYWSARLRRGVLLRRGGRGHGAECGIQGKWCRWWRNLFDVWYQSRSWWHVRVWMWGDAQGIMFWVSSGGEWNLVVCRIDRTPWCWMLQKEEQDVTWCISRREPAGIEWEKGNFEYGVRVYLSELFVCRSWCVVVGFSEYEELGLKLMNEVLSRNVFFSDFILGRIDGWQSRINRRAFLPDEGNDVDFGNAFDFFWKVGLNRLFDVENLICAEVIQLLLSFGTEGCLASHRCRVDSSLSMETVFDEELNGVVIQNRAELWSVWSSKLFEYWSLALDLLHWKRWLRGFELIKKWTFFSWRTFIWYQVAKETACEKIKKKLEAVFVLRESENQKYRSRMCKNWKENEKLLHWRDWFWPRKM